MTDEVEVEAIASGQPPYSPWPDLKAVAGCVLVALVAFAGSFLVPGPTTNVVRTTAVGPISTAAAQPRTVILGQSHSSNASFDLDLRFRFRIDVLKTGETLFDVGSPKAGVTAWVSRPIDGYRYVVVSGPGFSAVLVNHVVAGQTYAASVVIEGGKSITASVDGRQQFSYDDLRLNLLPSVKSATIGGPSPASLGRGQAASGQLGSNPSPLLGTVSGFTLSSRELAPAGSATVISALRVLAGVAAFSALVLLALRFVTGALVARRLGVFTPSKRESPVWFQWVREHSLPIGLVLLVAGIATLAIVTPLDNAVVQQSGTQQLAAGDVGPNQRTTYALFGEPTVFGRAASVDVHLAFQLRLDGPLSIRGAAIPVVSTLSGDHGIQFMMGRSGGKPYLTATVGSNASLAPRGTYNLLFNFPLHQWVTASVDVYRSQSFDFMIDGQQVQSLTFNVPVLYPAPAVLTVDGAFGGSVRNVALQTTLYRQQPSRVPYLLIRLAQGMGIIAIIGATILLAQRLLTRVVPSPVRVRRPLVLTTFWTMGVGIVVNIVVDLFHFQGSSLLYTERNTWLYNPFVRFEDFFGPFELLRSFNPYNIQHGNYPPVGYWLLAPILWMNEYAALFLTFAVAVGFMIWWVSRSFTQGIAPYQRVLVVIVALLSLPVSFGIDRGNLDLVIFAMIVLGVAAFEQNRNVLAAWWFGFTSAAILFPVLYLLLFLRGRKLKYLVLGVVIAGFLSLLGFAGFRHGFTHTLYGFKEAFSTFQFNYDRPTSSTPYDGSIIGWVQSIGYAINGVGGAQAIENVIRPAVVPVDILAGLLLAWYLRFREGSLWHSLTLITGVFILLNESYYYDLLFLFIPLALFVRDSTVSRRGIVIGVLFGILLAPRAYFYLGNSRIDSSVLTTAPLLIALLAVVVYDGYRERAERGTRIEMARDEAEGSEAPLPTSV